VKLKLAELEKTVGQTFVILELVYVKLARQILAAHPVTSVMTLLLFVTSTALLVKLGKHAHKELAQNVNK
jgi:hypothetical protein